MARSSTKYLYSKSLESHMRAYRDQSNLEQANIEWQRIQNEIVRNSERMNLNAADIINKIEQAQQELINSTINKMIPLSSTNSPEPIQNKTPLSVKISPRISLDELKEKKLKKTASNKPKGKQPSPFQQELEEKIKKMSPSSSKATTASTSANSPSELSLGKGSFMTEKNKWIKDREKNNLPVPNEVRSKKITQSEFNRIISEIGGSGLRKKR
jgi:hypothetical protein